MSNRKEQKEFRDINKYNDRNKGHISVYKTVAVKKIFSNKLSDQIKKIISFFILFFILFIIYCRLDDTTYTMGNGENKFSTYSIFNKKMTKMNETYKRKSNVIIVKAKKEDPYLEIDYSKDNLPISEVCRTKEDWNDFKKFRIKDKLVLYYDSDAGWEIDMMYWLFGKNIEIKMVSWSSQSGKPVEIDHNDYGKYIAVFKAGMRVYNTKAMIKSKPILAFMLSDERLYARKALGTKNLFSGLQKQGTTILRHYNDPEQVFLPYKNDDQIGTPYVLPLGFTAGQVKDVPFDSNFLHPNSLKKSSDRKYVFSFVGHLRISRKELLKVRLPNNRKMLPHGIIGKTNTSEIPYWYTNSKFIFNPRGFVSLNCYRIWESIMYGAIPVVLSEVDSTKIKGDVAYWFGKVPSNSSGISKLSSVKELPFVVEDDWDKAISKVEYLLENPKELDSLQRRMIDWWDKSMCTLRHEIKRNLKDALSLHKLKSMSGPIDGIKSYQQS